MTILKPAWAAPPAPSATATTRPPPARISEIDSTADGGLTSQEIKRILLPLMDFRSEVGGQTLHRNLASRSPESITDKRALEAWITTGELALGNPYRKYRETKDGDDLEDWIYGQPPGKVTFVPSKATKSLR